ncbi:MAG: hypothetical protein QOC69_646 [Mycobacterium sp.]|nr:hypothetical protein [Mycobacterium sp.]
MTSAATSGSSTPSPRTSRCTPPIPVRRNWRSCSRTGVTRFATPRSRRSSRPAMRPSRCAGPSTPASAPGPRWPSSDRPLRRCSSLVGSVRPCTAQARATRSTACGACSSVISPRRATTRWCWPRSSSPRCSSWSSRATGNRRRIGLRRCPPRCRASIGSKTSRTWSSSGMRWHSRWSSRILQRRCRRPISRNRCCRRRR